MFVDWKTTMGRKDAGKRVPGMGGGQIAVRSIPSRTLAWGKGSA